MEENSAHRSEGGVGDSSSIWLVRTLIRYACKPLLAMSFLLAFLVDLVIYIPVMAVLRKGHSFTRAFGASDWADMSIMMFFRTGKWGKKSFSQDKGGHDVFDTLSSRDVIDASERFSKDF